MGIWDNIADRYFAKDGSGKLVFLPCGRSKPSYYVDSTDESKIKSLVKMYVVAVALISLTGMIAVIGFTDSLLSDERGASLAHQLKFGGVVWAIATTLFYVGPSLLLWKTYRRAVDGICASLTAVDLASVQLAPLPSNLRRVRLIALIAGFVCVAIAILVMIGYRP